jgi:hypothetical protein
MTTDVSEEEKTWLITIDEIAATGVNVGTLGGVGEKYAARRYINGLTEVDYEYDSENDPANAEVVIFFSEADVHRNEDLAVKAFGDAIEAYIMGAQFGSNDVEVVEVPNHISLGFQNYSAYFEINGVKFGNLVVVQKETVVYSLMLAGPYIKYAETIENLIGPKLDLAVK